MPFPRVERTPDGASTMAGRGHTIAMCAGEPKSRTLARQFPTRCHVDMDAWPEASVPAEACRNRTWAG